MTLLPIVSPPFIVALSYILLFGVQGIVTKQLLGLHVDIYGRLGLWIVQTVTFFPYAYSVIYGVIRSISTNLEYAAYNMGAPRWRVFKDVFWPLCRPGVAGGALVAAINVLTDFGNPQMIGGRSGNAEKSEGARHRTDRRHRHEREGDDSGVPEQSPGNGGAEPRLREYL